MTDDCTCHPYDNPPRPCPQKYALGACRLADAEARADHALALVAEAYEVAAVRVGECFWGDYWSCDGILMAPVDLANSIRALTPADAVAARDARDKQVEAERDAIRSEALDWRAQVAELSDKVKALTARLRELEAHVARLSVAGDAFAAYMHPQDDEARGDHMRAYRKWEAAKHEAFRALAPDTGQDQ